MTRASQLDLVNVNEIVVLLPDAVDPEQIAKLADVAKLGGKITVDGSFHMSTASWIIQQPKSNKVPATASPQAQAPTKTQDCQTGSICNQDSPNSGTQTVNNIGLYPARVLPADVKNYSHYLAVLSSKAEILYPQGDGEAYNYAKSIAKMLSDAGWSVDDPSAAQYLSEGAPQYGLTIRYKGDKLQPGETVHVDGSTPWGRLIMTMQHLQGMQDTYADPAPHWTEGVILVMVYPNPKSRPQ
jgi:hypothetical protein